MDKIAYCNDLMARMEELFFHELSDCAGWKTEFIGVDFIHSKNIEGKTREEIIEGCLREITRAGLAREVSYAVAGRDILLCLKVKGCLHLGKEARLRDRGIRVYNCLIANMINDQLIEKLGYETTYVASIDVDEQDATCLLKVAIYETPDKIGCVSNWADEWRRIDANRQWVTISG
jgi:hypothetical protein